MPMMIDRMNITSKGPKMMVKNQFPVTSPMISIIKSITVITTVNVVRVDGFCVLYTSLI